MIYAVGHRGRMKKTHSNCSKFLQVSMRLVLAVVIAALIAVYIATFGFQITNDHVQWGEIASAMSGIYTPILSVLTLTVLIIQVRLQNKSTIYNSDQS